MSGDRRRSTRWPRPWGRFGLYSFFIDAPEPAIVDTGIASSPAEGMAPALEALGRRIEDVRWILLTHGHIDHVGGAHALWELTGRRAQVVIHEADAPMLRSRRAHVEEYPAGRGRYLRDPEGEAKLAAAADAVISGEMEPTRLSDGRRDAVARRRRHRLGPRRSRATRPGSVAYVVDGQDDVFVGDAVQVHGAANGFPGYDDPDAYRASLTHLRDEIRPAAPVPRAPLPPADGTPYGVELDREQAQRGARRRASTSRPASRAAQRRRPTAWRSPTRRTRPSRSVAEELGYTGDPTLEPSPFFTTMHGYRTQHEQELHHG